MDSSEQNTVGYPAELVHNDNIEIQSNDHQSISSPRFHNKPLPPVPTRPSDFQKTVSLVNMHTNLKPSSPPVPPKKLSSDQGNVRRLQSLPSNLNTISEQKPENPRNATSLYVPSPGSKVPPPVPPKKPTIQRLPVETIQKNGIDTDSESGSSSSRSYQTESFSDLDNLNNDEIHLRRTNIVNEILSTEKSYIKGLTNIIKVWIEPIKHQDVNDPVVPPDMIKYLFSNIEVILNVNNQFLKDFEEKMESWSPTQCVGIVFLTLIPFFKVYMDYINNYNKSIEVYQELMKKKNFRKFAEECSKQFQLQSLSSYLITPIQRIPRYQLLLSELYKYTPISHPDYNDIEQALDKIKTVASEINSRKKDAENLHQCAVIQDLMLYPEELKKKSKNLVSPSRRLIHEGEHEVLLNGIKSSIDYIVLFSDSLLLCKKKKKGLLYFGLLYNSRLDVFSNEDGITIKPHSYKDCVLYIYVNNESSKRTLLRGFSKKIDALHDEDDELLLSTLQQELGKREDKPTLSKKKSFRKRILTLGKKDKPKQIESERKKPVEEQEQNNEVIKINPGFNHELLKKLESRNLNSNFS